MVRSLRIAAAALVLGALAIGTAGQASAHPIRIGWGWHHGWGGWGWAPRRVIFLPRVAGCYTQRWIGPYGGPHWRRVCY